MSSRQSGHGMASSLLVINISCIGHGWGGGYTIHTAGLLIRSGKLSRFINTCYLYY